MVRISSEVTFPRDQRIIFPGGFSTVYGTDISVEGKFGEFPELSLIFPFFREIDRWTGLRVADTFGPKSPVWREPDIHGFRALLGRAR